MRTLIAFLFCLASFQDLNSQILKGTIKDAQGEPIPYATVYIQELRQGTTANTKGDYEIKLPPGKYTVIYESLGFQPWINNVNLSKNPVTVNVILQMQTYEIPEVRITASGEDAAYGIMRKVIGMAPYYLNHVSSYKAEVYLKGNLILEKIPKIIQRRIKAEARKEAGGSVGDILKEGDTYLMESFNEIEFNAPDTYKQHVISMQSTFPEQGSSVSPMDFIQASFYQPVLVDMFISPLSPEAFFHYKFKYMGLSSQGEYYVDKIQVTPKRKSQQLFEGTIYVIEDLWCLHSVDLINENLAGKIRVQQLYIPVQEDVWMPVSHKFEASIAILGIKGEAGYGSSIKYSEVKVNTNLKKPEGLSEFKSKTATRITATDTVKSKTTKQIEQILSKEELTNRDMVKLSGLLNKQSRESMPDSVKNTLEVKDRTTFVVEKDANKKDSSFWAGIRPIPLSENEIKSIRSSDSIKATLSHTAQKSDTAKKSAPARKGFFPFMGKIFFGGTWSDTSGFSFTNGGLLNLKNTSFNTVDGLVYGADFRINKTWQDKYRLGIYPAFFYAFSREAFMWRVNGNFNFGDRSQRQLYFRTGSISKDINGPSGISPLVNTFTTLLLESNYLKLYSGNYATLGYSTEISNGLYLEIQTGYENRKILSNTTDFTLIETSKTYTSNIPVNRYLQDPNDSSFALKDHRHGDVSFTLRYTPFQHYTIRGEKKIPRYSAWPTFSLTWKHGINDFPGLVSGLQQYDQVRFEAYQRMDVGAMGEFRWRYRAGGFLRKTGFTFIDFNHFNSQYFPVLIKDYQDAFMLTDFYSLSTPEIYSELHTKFTTPYLLLKLLPGLSKTLMRENLSLSFLWSKYQMAYTEIGYSISEILLMGEIGVYAGFNNFSYNSVGVKLIFKFD